MPDGYKVDECDCKDCPCRTELITNADRFRDMSDEEQQNFVRKFLEIVCGETLPSPALRFADASFTKNEETALL